MLCVTNTLKRVLKGDNILNKWEWVLTKEVTRERKVGETSTESRMDGSEKNQGRNVTDAKMLCLIYIKSVLSDFVWQSPLFFFLQVLPISFLHYFSISLIKWKRQVWRYYCDRTSFHWGEVHFLVYLCLANRYATNTHVTYVSLVFVQ